MKGFLEWWIGPTVVVRVGENCERMGDDYEDAVTGRIYNGQVEWKGYTSRVCPGCGHKIKPTLSTFKLAQELVKKELGLGIGVTRMREGNIMGKKYKIPPVSAAFNEDRSINQELVLATAEISIEQIRDGKLSIVGGSQQDLGNGIKRISFDVKDNDPGEEGEDIKTHPVFAEHPGKAKGHEK